MMMLMILYMIWILSDTFYAYDIDFQALNHVFLEQIDLALMYYNFVYH